MCPHIDCRSIISLPPSRTISCSTFLSWSSLCAMTGWALPGHTSSQLPGSPPTRWPHPLILVLFFFLLSHIPPSLLPPSLSSPPPLLPPSLSPPLPQFLWNMEANMFTDEDSKQRDPEIGDLLKQMAEEIKAGMTGSALRVL